jgi:hypothetical protein
VKQLRTSQSHKFFCLGVNHQRGMQEETVPASVAGRSQAGDIAAKIDLSRVPDQEPRAPASCAGELPMGFTQVLKRDIVLIEQPIGGFAVAPGFGLGGRTAIGMRGSLSRQSDRSLCSSRIAQLTLSKVLFGPSIDIQLHRCHENTSVLNSVSKTPSWPENRSPPLIPWWRPILTQALCQK